MDKFDNQRLADFFNYWSEEDTKTGKMRYEKQCYWNIERRIKRWMSNSFASNDTAAALRLEKARKGRSKETRQQAAVERDDANEELFRQIEENKKKAVSYDEYLKRKNGNES